jgi:predicted O-methyltransferase YrrM
VSTRFVYRHEDRRPLGYEPIYRSFEPSLYVPRIGARGYLGAAHEGVVEAVETITGKLMPGDQYKLYEAAYFARGAILEVGRLHGKSTAVLAMGMRDGVAAGIGAAPGTLYSVELNDKYEPLAEAHLRERGLLELVTLLRGDSAGTIAELPGQFDTIFVDGDHSYDGITRDLKALHGRVVPGGVLMFHDRFHPANETGEYGVTRALAERAEAMGIAYRGRFGGMALYEQLGDG